MVLNTRYTIWNIDRCNATKCESIVSDARHAIGNGDRGQTAAISERIVADAHHTIGNGDGSQTAALSVFASIFLSAIYISNGRKVISVILKADRK